ncbi:MAG: polysaccharide biosynthesis protein [Synergistetes bacterium]|nr:polysaccharide biosynthesis protein [Synergistota bacterium]MCX8127421.1 polysaccharide biosynthesis protein [Synergistota bacterium]MDW8192285.1 SDR family NAD(P)-dependent oxidoreductase [Synergistota bacterium]
MKDLESFFEGKRILVSGGTGSIGKEIVFQLLKLNPQVIRIFSRDEHKLFQLREKIGDDKRVRYLLGDIRDKERLRWAIEDVDIVFHAAALKHVTFCEYNPFESVKTNVIGTQNLLEVSLEKEVSVFITISSDKAVNPTNTLGASKLLAEKLTLSANHYKGRRKSLFSVVRFGNVLGSRGSVIPKFISQIKRGGPLTLTHPAMRRYMMTVSEAVNLVLKAAFLTKGEEVFILKMPKVWMYDLAEVVIEVFAPKFGFSPRDIKIEFIGVQAGEKIDERLFSEEEIQRLKDFDDFYIISDKQGKPAVFTEERFLSKNEIRDILESWWRGLEEE